MTTTKHLCFTFSLCAVAIFSSACSKQTPPQETSIAVATAAIDTESNIINKSVNDKRHYRSITLEN